MNLNREAEVFIGMTVHEFIVFAVLVIINFIVAFIIYSAFKTFLIAIIVFLFLTANSFIIVQLIKKLPDRYFIHLWKYIKNPKIYLPKRRDN